MPTNRPEIYQWQQESQIQPSANRFPPSAYLPSESVRSHSVHRITTKLSRGQPAKRGGRRLERLVRRQFGGPTPRSRQSFRARISTISACQGIADLRLRAGLCHHEYLPPSWRSSQPLFRRCLNSCRRFIRRPGLPHTRHQQPPSPPAD